MNCSWRALRLPKQEDHRFSCRVIPVEGFEYDFALFNERDERRLDTAYNTSEISYIFEPSFYCGQFPNGTYYIAPGILKLLFTNFNHLSYARIFYKYINIHTTLTNKFTFTLHSHFTLLEWNVKNCFVKLIKTLKINRKNKFSMYSTPYNVHTNTMYTVILM